MEAVARTYSVKKVFLKISQNSQKDTSVGDSFCCRPETCNFTKKETLAHMYFPVNFVKFLKTPFFIEHFGGYFFWLKLY